MMVMSRQKEKTRVSIAGIVALLAAALGGGREPVQPTAAPASSFSPMRAAAVRQQLLEEDPNLLIGEVVEAYPQGQLVAVANAPVDRFQPGDVVVFIDAE